MKIVQIHAAINFKIEPDILLSVGNNIKKLQKEVKVNVQILNVPKASPPETPRIVIFSPNAIINICLSRYDIIVKIPKQIEDNIDSSLDYAKNVITKFIPFLIHENFQYLWTGIVINSEKAFDIKNSKSIELMTPFYDKLINIDRNNMKLSSFQLQFGFEENNLYKNYTISGYDKINIAIPGNIIGESSITIDLQKAKISESGLQVIVDVNNRTNINVLGIDQDFINLLHEVSNTYKLLPNTLNIEGLI
jgi:hypothetical protein